VSTSVLKNLWKKYRRTPHRNLRGLLVPTSVRRSDARLVDPLTIATFHLHPLLRGAAAAIYHQRQRITFRAGLGYNCAWRNLTFLFFNCVFRTERCGELKLRQRRAAKFLICFPQPHRCGRFVPHFQSPVAVPVYSRRRSI